MGRAYVPLGVLVVVEVVRFAAGAAGAAGLALGALVAGLATLAYGMRTVHRALGRPRAAWMTVAAAGSVVPPAYGLWVLGWAGLRALTEGAAAGPLLTAILHAGVGVWVLRTWLGVLEIERLAQIMLLNPNDDGGSP